MDNKRKNKLIKSVKIIAKQCMYFVNLNQFVLQIIEKHYFERKKLYSIISQFRHQRGYSPIFYPCYATKTN